MTKYAGGPTNKWPCKVLTYHRVLPAELLAEQITQRSIMVSLESFRNQMLYVRRKYKMLTPDEFLLALQSGAGFSRPSCVVTFDDGWRDNYLYAFPILKELRIPAAIFVAVDHVENGSDFWPERLARILYELEPTANNLRSLNQFLPLQQTKFPDADLAEYANLTIIALKRKPRKDIEEMLSLLQKHTTRKRNSIRTERAICHWYDLKEMLSSGLVTIGSHTLSHSILACEEEEIRHKEILNSKKILEKKLGAPVLHFSYPNGNFDDRTERLVIQAGYQSAYTCLYGTNNFSTSPFRIRRIHVAEPFGNGAMEFSKFKFSLRISSFYQQLKKARCFLRREAS